MRLSKVIKQIVLFVFLSVNLFANSNDKININFKDLEINDLIKITSKIINKNILITNNIKGKVDFISNKPIYKKDILNLVIYVLESKGYTIVENNDILRVIRLNDAAKYNTPVYSNTKDLNSYKIVTEVFNIEYSNVDYVSSKIRHLISKSAKLVTDKESNAIIITDFYDNIKTIKEVISLISKDSKKTIESVELKNLQAASILNDLKSVAKTVFNEKIEKEKVEILLNKDTNSILFVGKKSNVEFMVQYLKDIEVKGSLVEKVVEVVYLKNIESKNILTIINGILAQKVYKDKNDKPFASTDEESNAIILMGPKEEISSLKILIDMLDVDRQQVYVQARIIEVSQKGSSNMGIKYGIEGLKSGGSGALTFAGNLGGASLALSPETLSSVSLPNVTNGIVMGASINLMKQNYALDVVSEPSILCINNKESSIYVGETRSIPTGTTVGTTTTTNYKREDIGLKLKVKPRISTGNKVTLDIQTILEDVTETDQTSGQPNTNKKEVTTTAIVNNGESVILGGLIKNKAEKSVDKIPFFGDIPIIGALFRNNSKLDDKINLVIIVTPYIIPQSKDLSFIRNELAQLKILEDKYTKDLSLRLEKMRLSQKNDDLKREKEKLKLNYIKDDLKDDMIDFSEDKKDFEDDKKEQEQEEVDEDMRLHQQRVKEMFGI